MNRHQQQNHQGLRTLRSADELRREHNRIGFLRRSQQRALRNVAASSLSFSPPLSVPSQTQQTNRPVRQQPLNSTLALVQQVLPLRRDGAVEIGPEAIISNALHYVLPQSHTYNNWGENCPVIKESTVVHLHLTYADRLMLSPEDESDTDPISIALVRVPFSVVAPTHVISPPSQSLQWNPALNFDSEPW